MKSVLNERDGYFESITVELDASEALVFTRALVKFAEDDSEHSIDRLVATRMVRELQTIADTPQTDCYMCKWMGDRDVCGRCRNRNLFAVADTPQTDCKTCKHYKLACELFSEVCKYEPTIQTETQNSNLTFEKDAPQTDCDDRYAVRTDSGEVVAYVCPLGCEQTDCGWRKPDE